MSSVEFTAGADPGDPPLIQVVILVLIVVCVLIVLAVAAYFLLKCVSGYQFADPSKDGVSHATTRQMDTGNLIPPLFYTEGLRDPLMQEDLRERPPAIEPMGTHL
jgi:hypothetical protein